ncbi:MAG: proton-conducting membrane transporter [Oscillospiraceae bacterium]|nr:proton-conducting membrane transporter [Oscillospiraceae bacterium]
MMTLLPVFFPVLTGLYLLKTPIKDRKSREKYVFYTLLITLIFTVITNFAFNDAKITFARFAAGVELAFHIDSVAVLFSTLFAAVWTTVGVFSMEYMKHEGEENRFFAFFISSLGGLIGVAYADNLATLYLFFELMSLLSYVLVVHSRTSQSLLAGRKYIYYSLFGASLGLIAVFYFYSTGWSTSFTEGGVVPAELGSRMPAIALCTIMAVIGFGCKGGMFPLHAWLPTAHPQAPAPASSVLSGLITKAGVIAIIRVIYFTVGVAVLKGTYVQYFLLTLAIVTVFMGSMLAYKEKVLKKRLAYSTVSQVSYVIFGLMLMNEAGVTGALLQVVFHALAKNVLFLTAGAFIYKTGKTMVSDLYAMGKSMPKVLVCFTVAGLSLVGVPLTAGFVSKWYLALGALQTGSGVIGFVGIATIMVSALLTGGYLVSVTAKAFFANRADEVQESFEPNNYMIVPLAVLTVLIVIFGVFPAPVISFVGKIARSVF